MKDKDIKKLIEKSEVATSVDFTDKVMQKIEAQNVLPSSITIWSLRQIIVGFILVTVISIYLIHHFLGLKILAGNIAVPFFWTLLLLMGLNYLLTINRYKKI
ncbi:hypothetical protein [Aquimarina intermedia]|uniref:Uncharacterized protein n=1 Tax=Aquimarina intermedia TaxID=350814 RepID=A0A5S5C8U2_9FLAO|nr:hypothetical protein [Aquimarina intermedia]TYP74403.1 hypothetical protein BD809_104223 [Aquimarina intermedia]